MINMMPELFNQETLQKLCDNVAKYIEYNDDCIICGKSGGLYLTCGKHKSGPYCSIHRFELGCHIKLLQNQATENRFLNWVSEYWEGKKYIQMPPEPYLNEVGVTNE